jgi:SAM-dependent methyltransferase
MGDLRIKDFWEERGVAAPSGELTTHRDAEQVKLEIESILELLKPSDTLLDIGCGTGFSTAVYAQRCKDVVGLDYSQEMIKTAQRIHKRNNLRFICGDVLALDEQLGKFTAVLSTRCLINLGGWPEQKQALERIHSRIAPGGCLILAEGTMQGRAALNGLRVKRGLCAMPPVWHNKDFNEDELRSFLDQWFTLEKDIRFGLYDVLTRVYYPLVIRPREPQYGTVFHRWARCLSRWFSGKGLSIYSREFIMVFRKKDA